MYFRVFSFFQSGFRQALSFGVILSIGCFGNLQCSSIKENIDSEFAYVLREALDYLPQATIAFVKDPKCDPKIQAAMAVLLSPSEGIPRPACLEISNVAQLMESTYLRRRAEESAQQKEFTMALDNHMANTPPYIYIPAEMPKAARQVIFDRLKHNSLVDVKAQVQKARIRKLILDKNENPSEVQLSYICRSNYKHLYTDLLSRMIALKRTCGWMEAICADLIDQNTLENLLKPLPDLTNLQPKNALEYKSIPSLVYLGRLGLKISGAIIQEFKNFYPLTVFLEKHLPPHQFFLKGFRDVLFDLECQYAATSEYLAITDRNYHYYLDLSQNRKVPLNGPELVLLYNAIEQNDQKCATFVVERKEKLIKQEYDAIDKEVEEYYDMLQTAKAAAKQKAQRELEEKKKQKSQSQKDNARKTMAEAARLTQELSKAAAEKAAAERAAASQASVQANAVNGAKREYATNEGAYTAWHWASLKDFNAKKEARKNAQALLSKEQTLAQSKTAKNHTIDEKKAAAASVAVSSTSKVPEKPESKIEPIILGSNHYGTYELLMTNKDCGLDKESVGNVFRALGGHMDPNDHSGSRVALYILDTETGNELTIVPHYHTKNGVKTFRPEQILDIRNLLIKAGYDKDRVIQKIGADYENTVPKSSTQTTQNTAATSSTSSTSSLRSASTSSKAPSATSSKNNNDDDDGE